MMIGCEHQCGNDETKAPWTGLEYCVRIGLRDARIDWPSRGTRTPIPANRWPNMNRNYQFCFTVLGLLSAGGIAGLGCSTNDGSRSTVDAVPRPAESPRIFIPQTVPQEAGILECSGRVAIVTVKTESEPCWCRTSDEERSPQELPKRVISAIEKSREYLRSRSMLPPHWRMCATPVENGELHVTCWPTTRYLNSPVTLVVYKGEVVGRYYSDTNDREQSDLD